MTPGVRPGTHRGAVVLDNEAAQALADVGHPKHRQVLGYVDAVAVRTSRGARTATFAPTAVRVEAGIDRRSAGAAAFTRFQVKDAPLDSGAADRSAALRPTGGSAVDATVAAVAADLAGEDAEVVVLTADLTDIPRLVAATGAEGITVRRL